MPDGARSDSYYGIIADIIDRETNLQALLRIKEAARVFCDQVEQRDEAGADTGDMPIEPYNKLRAALSEVEQ